MRLSAENLGWAPGGKPVVSGVTLEVRSGETLGLIGPNGSGKSTLLRLMLGLLPGASGEARLDGRPLASFSRREIARRVAFVEQQAETSEALTARDAVELGRTPWLSPFAPFSAEDRAAVAEALETVGMAALAERRWSALSGGERQRVQIARALAQRPRILLLDEPTNHLDVHHQLALLRLVSRLPATVVIALHDLNQAMGCDRLAVMQEGRMVGLGRPIDVLTPALLRSVFRVGSSVLKDPVDQVPIFRFHHLED